MIMLQISVSNEQMEFIHEQIATRGLKNFDEYFAELLLEERRRLAEEEFEKFIQESIDSGEPEEITELWLNDLKADLRRIHHKREFIQ